MYVCTVFAEDCVRFTIDIETSGMRVNLGQLTGHLKAYKQTLEDGQLILLAEQAVRDTGFTYWRSNFRRFLGKVKSSLTLHCISPWSSQWLQLY